jgi:hypothetical protein
VHVFSAAASRAVHRHVLEDTEVRPRPMGSGAPSAPRGMPDRCGAPEGLDGSMRGGSGDECGSEAGSGGNVWRTRAMASPTHSEASDDEPRLPHSLNPGSAEADRFAASLHARQAAAPTARRDNVPTGPSTRQQPGRGSRRSLPTAEPEEAEPQHPARHSERSAQRPSVSFAPAPEPGRNQESREFAFDPSQL